MSTNCPFCEPFLSNVLVEDDLVRVVVAAEPGYPGFCRVILRHHVREMTDLAPATRTRVMDAVFQVEAALREVLSPFKMNLASLGNRTPHLHWHIIPRYEDDPHFPEPVWLAPLRDVVPRPVPEDYRGKLVRLLLAAGFSEPRPSTDSWSAGLRPDPR